MLIATKAVHTEGKTALPAPKFQHAFGDVPLPTGPAFDEQNVSERACAIPGSPPRTRPISPKAIARRFRPSNRWTISSPPWSMRWIGAGKLDNTVIIYTSDNGFLFGDHRLVGKIAPYEASIKVPLIIRGPGIPANETRTQLVNNLDVVATIEDSAEATPGLAPDGHSLRPLFAHARRPGAAHSLSRMPSPASKTPSFASSA